MTTARPYERRRTRPVAILVAVLAVGAVATWTVVLTTAGGASVIACPAPAEAPPPGEVLPLDALAAVVPAAPGATRITVLNAGGQRGQANLVAAQLTDLGFTEAGSPANDELFPDGTMACAGQLRFGSAGDAPAATLVLVLPCAELVRDGRADDTVDVVVGTEFGDLAPPREVVDALAGLGAPGDGSGTAPAAPDPEALAAARDAASC